MKNNSPHVWWIVGLLSTIIILLISYIIWGKISDAQFIINYVSCASIILSITLSVFAILYTYVSNVQIQQQFEKINSAAISISDTSNKLIQTEGKLNDFLETIEERLSNIDKSQTEMTQQISNINKEVETSSLSNIPSS